MSVHDRRRAWYDCQRCGHPFEQHHRHQSVGVACRGYHCRCRGFVAIEEHRWWGSR